MSTVYTFEITPFHPTRKVYDSIIFPAAPEKTIFCYEKDMTVQQAIAALNTCAYMKIKYNDAWYSVNEKNIDAITAAIDAGETLTETAVDAGLRTMRSYLTPVAADVDAYGKTAGVLADIKMEDGYIYGTVYPVTNYTGFNSDVAEQSGYFFPFAWTTNDKFQNAKMRVVNGKHPENQVALDPVNVIFLGKDVEEGGRKIVEITATDADGNTVSVTMQMKNLKFDPNPSPYVVAAVPPVVDPTPAPANVVEDEVVG